jgi:TRAP-type C4-dicarboxylate transport system permease small subunit
VKFVASIAVKPETRLHHVLYWISRGLSIIGAVALAVMMMLAVIDVGGRYLFNKPLVGAWELTGLLLVYAAALGLGYCQLEKHHIRVTFLYDRFSPRWQAFIDSFSHLVGAAGFVMISWQSFIKTAYYFGAGDMGLSETMGVVLWPFTLALAIGTAMITIVLLIDLAQSGAKVVKK